MYNRYLRDRNGSYVCQRVADPAPVHPPTPEPERQTAQTAPQSAPRKAEKLALRDLDTDDLLIAAILVLLLQDGDRLDWTSLLAGFLYLFL
jgi:hypothetical protein